MENLRGLTAAEAERKLKEYGFTAKFSGNGETVTGQIPAAGQRIPGGSEVLLYLEQEPEEAAVTVPDFFGMHRQQAEETAEKLGLYVLVTGNNEQISAVTVTAQDIPKDTQVSRGTTITLEFTDTTARD